MDQQREKIRLFQLAQDIQNTLRNRYENREIRITAQVTDIKKQVSLRRCYLKFIEKQGNDIIADIRGVFWADRYGEIERFEKITGKPFSDGLEITCVVTVKFHPRFGLSLEVQEIEVAYALGSLELERQQTLDRLAGTFPNSIRLIDGEYFTYNKSLPLPSVIQKIALITAVNSDGQRDFNQELKGNKYGYFFEVSEYLTQIQGDQAHLMIQEKLDLILQSSEKPDIVAIVRGGGSQTDFKPFDQFELAAKVAHFPIPVFTGIGHDRNTSITDLMARQEKTPTKVAARITDHNYEWETNILMLKERFFLSIAGMIRSAAEEMKGINRVIRAASPETVLKRGFTIIRKEGKIISDPADIDTGDKITFNLKNSEFKGQITGKENL
jgi:exodeoxyribonuclease VII large subunit